MSGAVPDTQRFYLSKPSHELFRDTLLHQTHHSMQSFTFDNVNRRLFIVQPCNGDLDDLCINQVSFTGVLEGQMRLSNAGHGVSIGVEPVGSESYIWMECDKSGSGDAARGTALARFRFIDGAVPEVRKFLAGSDTITCATDPLNNRLVVRRVEDGAFWYSLYDLTAAGGVISATRSSTCGSRVCGIREVRRSRATPAGQLALHHRWHRRPRQRTFQLLRPRRQP